MYDLTIIIGEGMRVYVDLSSQRDHMSSLFPLLSASSSILVAKVPPFYSYRVSLLNIVFDLNFKLLILEEKCSRVGYLRVPEIPKPNFWSHSYLLYQMI